MLIVFLAVSLQLEFAFSSRPEVASLDDIWRVIFLAKLQQDYILIALSSYGSLMMEEISGARCKRNGYEFRNHKQQVLITGFSFHS